MAGVVITYKGTAISNLTSTVTKTLGTEGKYCEGNITVAYTAPQIEATASYAANGFKSAIGLTSIKENGSATTIGDSCFYGCTNLTSVDGFASLTTIDESAFYGCSSLTDLPTEPTITTLGKSAFCNCTSLEEFKMKTNVSALPVTIFKGCTSLREVVLSGTLTTACNPNSNGNAIFNGCTALESLTLPGGSYGAYVAYNNKNLATVTIGGLGNPVTSIGNNAFYGCNGVGITFTVYTVNATELSHNSNSNYWGSNKTGTSCTFKDSNGVADDYTISF